MPDCEERGKSRFKPTFTTSLVPRQLLLSSSSPKLTMAQLDKANSGKPTVSLSSQDRIHLFHTICEFLELNGFHKTLKKFRSEADIEKDSWKNCLVNLEKLFQEHLRMHNDADVKVLKQKGKSDKTEEKTKGNQVDDGKRSGARLENGTVTDDDIKPKKKKKGKSGDASDQVNAENHLKTSEHQAGDTLSEPAEAVKKSKKKKQKDTSEDSDKNVKELSKGDTLGMPSGPVKKSKDKKKKHKDETEVDEAQKGSKKRKKSSFEGLADGDAEERATDDTKRRKVDDSDKSNGDGQAPKTPEQTSNGNIEEDGGEKATKQEKTKERNGSAEPTSVKAFQRVKAEEVKFIDDRLKDNSYWAKDGAESGFGAKAQEVLGQVRGRFLALSDGFGFKYLWTTVPSCPFFPGFESQLPQSVPCCCDRDSAISVSTVEIGQTNIVSIENRSVATLNERLDIIFVIGS